MATSTPLTDTLIRGLKATGSAYRKADGNGLFLEVTPKGKKVWRYRAKNVAGTKSGQILLTLGEYPVVSLAEARKKRQELRELIAKGLDPRQVAKEKERAERQQKASTLEKVAVEWLEVRKGKIQADTWKATDRRFRKHVFPVLGDKPIREITVQDVLGLIRTLEDKSTNIPRVVKAELGRIFSYAIQLGLADSNPATSLLSKDVLKPHKTTHHKTVGIDELPIMLAKIEADSAMLQTKTAVKLIMMLFMRKGELLKSEWSHIDLDAGLWTVPADNTKKRREQVYPLPRQAVAILNELQRFTGNHRYVFSTGARNEDAPMGQSTINQVFRRNGYNREQTVHGLRALATSWLDEQGYSRQAIERQLSHLEDGKTNQAYHRADYMEERREMLQAWADYLDSIRVDSTNAEESSQTAEKVA